MAYQFENIARVATGQLVIGSLSNGTARIYGTSSNAANNLLSIHSLGSVAGNVLANGQIVFGPIGFCQQAVNAGNGQNIAFHDVNGAKWCTGQIDVDATMTPSKQVVLNAPVGVGQVTILIG